MTKRISLHTRGNYLVIFVAFLFAVLASSCSGGYDGQLLGVLDRPNWRNINPYGMIYVPSGHLHIGPSDEDINNALTARAKSISIQGFYMDDTEITNNEYRQFVFWVTDSIAHRMLGGEHLFDEGEESERIDWGMPIYYEDPEVRELLSSLYYPKNESLWGTNELNPDKIVYQYVWYDWKEASKRTSTNKSRSSFRHTEPIKAYPDTLCWIRDFSYSYNEPMARNYFWHPAFDDYPVVGVSWKQAIAFSRWRSVFWNAYKAENGETMYEEFRLPIEGEWEYASRGGFEESPYPWGGPYVRNRKGCILANFKPGRGNYPEDGGLYTVRADAYNPNDYGLYNMAGNVAEWTSSSFDENGYHFQHDLNPDIRYDAKDDEPETMKRKTIRGGSWKDIGYFIQTSTRHWEYQDSTKSYIGFRNALTFLGRSKSDFD